MSDDLLKRLRMVTGFIRFETGDRVAASACLSEEAAYRIEELEAENKRLNEQMDAIEEMGTESLNALPDCLMRLAPALVENDELKAKLAKAMQVVEMIASADVDAVLGQAVDISCEIIGELMEEDGDGSVFHPTQIRSSRVLDAEKLDALLAELRDTLAELKGQADE